MTVITTHHMGTTTHSTGQEKLASVHGPAIQHCRAKPKETQAQHETTRTHTHTHMRTHNPKPQLFAPKMYSVSSPASLVTTVAAPNAWLHVSVMFTRTAPWYTPQTWGGGGVSSFQCICQRHTHFATCQRLHHMYTHACSALLCFTRDGASCACKSRTTVPVRGTLPHNEGLLNPHTIVLHSPVPLYKSRTR
jgi:hypothetical protein